jgi:Tol biopolymer transport system component
VTTLFLPPENAWLTSASVAPDGSRIALAYAPPPPEGTAQLGYTGLHLLPGDCAARPAGCTTDDLTPLLEPAGSNEAYFSPVWSPDGQALYYAHFTPSQSDTSTPFQYTLERASVPPQGAGSALIENALWPALAPDGGQIAYVWFDPEDYSNELFTAQADGAAAARLVGSDVFEAVDAPFFSPDGSLLYFSAVGEGPGAAPAPSSAWLDRLLGARPAEAAPTAHNVPSDWWVVPVAGGEPTRLTQIYETGLFGDMSPDGGYIAFVAASGVYVMRPDGSDVTRLLPVGGGITLEWLP